MEGCNTGIETNNILMDAHFPGSTPLDDTLQSTASQADIDKTPNTCLRQETEDVSRHHYKLVLDKNLTNLSFLDPNRVKEAFNDMRSLNAGGPDGMKSIVFQNLPYNFLIRISKIYKACIKLNHTPPKWCEADVIFLAKPNQSNYDQPNSFRPISKFNVIL